MRYDAADIPRGDRIGDDTDDGTCHASIPRLLTRHSTLAKHRTQCMSSSLSQSGDTRAIKLSIHSRCPIHVALRDDGIKSFITTRPLPTCR